MYDFYKLTDTSYFSSDLNKSTLIFSEKNGSQQIIASKMSTIKTDHYKKHIRFYPPDDLCFTTTDRFMGLRVWDTNKECVVFNYPQDSLDAHAYSSENLVSAVSESGLKLYDLRVRYSIKSIPMPLCKDTLWNATNIIGYSDDEINVWDIRNERMIKQIYDHNIMKAIIFQNGICYAKKYEKTFFFCKDGLGYEVEVDSANLYSLDGSSDIFYTIMNNSVCFYEYNDKWRIVFDDISGISRFHFCADNIYMFSNDGLYFRENGYEKFKSECKDK